MKNKFENRSETRCGSFLYILYEVFFIPYEKISLKIKKEIFHEKRECKIFCVNEKIHTKKEVASVE